MIVKRWIIVLLYAVFIFVFTQSTASGASAMISWLKAWFPMLPNEQAVEAVVYLRKLIHIGGYFLAFVLIHSAVRVTPRLNRCAYTVSAALALTLAACDEWYQTRLSHRSGSVLDIALDLAGIGLAAAAVRVFHIARKSEKASSS
ncbi:MAG: VanZ family protein [Limnochordia bacterium]|nr:VanZ family protein [Bacillota bacterium]HOB08856.1 VanZ family protein [Limnochordia bacterium]NLH31746.1 VanZ family protein [Bacillota bacterium]HPT93072.1 VanZ family protein [Limnochordia bacterium]HPZ31054.1 VanZ family protein [Limnochordia bacterium]